MAAKVGSSDGAPFLRKINALDKCPGVVVLLGWEIKPSTMKGYLHLSCDTCDWIGRRRMKEPTTEKLFGDTP